MVIRKLMSGSKISVYRVSQTLPPFDQTREQSDRIQGTVTLSKTENSKLKLAGALEIYDATHC